MSNSNRTPLVSVVMCTYNGGKYISESISSILTQTYGNFEIIIWDDGSNDGTKEIINTFHDERIRYYYNENTGLGKALRLACSKAKGKYIARMDSDDISLPTRLVREVEFLESHEEYVLISGAVYVIDEYGKELRRTFPCSDDRVLKAVLTIPVSMIVHPMTMMRRDAYERAGGYLPIRKSQDVLFWSRMAKQGKFYNDPIPLGKYRLLSDSLDHSSNPYQYILSSFLRKMVTDDIVLDSDIELYNQIFLYSKQYIRKGEKEKYKNRRSFEEYLFCFLRILFGQNISAAFVVKLKNYYYRMKLGV